MARPQISVEDHDLKGTARRQPPKNDSEIEAGRALIPATLDRAERGQFKKYHAQLTARRTCTPGDSNILELAAVTYCRWRAECKALKERGPWITVTVLNSNGQPVQKEIENPDRKNSCESARQILALLKSLGLTPDTKDRVRPAKGSGESMDLGDAFLAQNVTPFRK